MAPLDLTKKKKKKRNKGVLQDRPCYRVELDEKTESVSEKELFCKKRFPWERTDRDYEYDECGSGRSVAPIKSSFMARVGRRKAAI